MLQLVISAILFLAPSMSPHRARNYAILVTREAAHRKVNPLVVVSVIHHETGGTWRARLRSHTNDYGLMQVHVSQTTHRRYTGREHLLYRPKLNIYLGTRFLGIAKKWHLKNCRKKNHKWWSHYNWGFRVLKNRRYERSVSKILNRLRLRFGDTGATSLVMAVPRDADIETSRYLEQMDSKKL